MSARVSYTSFHLISELAWAKSQAPDAVECVLSILNTMEQQGLQPDVRTYSSVIDAIAQSGHDPEQAEDILDRMTRAGVHPNVVTYNAAINGTSGLSGLTACLEVSFASFMPNDSILFQISLGEVTSPQCS